MLSLSLSLQSTVIATIRSSIASENCAFITIQSVQSSEWERECETGPKRSVCLVQIQFKSIGICSDSNSIHRWVMHIPHYVLQLRIWSEKKKKNWNARTQTQNDDLFIQSKWHFYCVVSWTLLQELRLVSLHSFRPILFNWIEKTVHFPFNTAFIAQCECTIPCVVMCRVPVCLL